MNKYIKSPLFKIPSLFLIWRIIILIISIYAVKLIPLASSDRFLGGGSRNYFTFPEFFSLANFDGEHYLSIAIFGYRGLEQAFFPIYPKLISFLSKPFYFDFTSATISSIIIGLIISNLTFLLSLFLLWKLLKIDFSQKIVFLTILLILTFPTSFYFGVLYNESLFLLLSLSSFYFARKGNWLMAGIFGALSSATRIFGILLLPAFLIEAWQQKMNLSRYFWIFLIPFGLAAYMLYQYLTIGDALAFYHLQKIVGEQHLSGVTFLPQVYYRYTKMLLTVDLKNPIYQTILLELIVGIAFFILPIYGFFKKLRYSYVFYAMVGFLLPTIQGSFSSVPRYVIVFFPSFIALALFLDKIPKLLKISFLFFSFCTLVLETALFLRGYWIA